MPDLTPNHPAVEALATRYASEMDWSMSEDGIPGRALILQDAHDFLHAAIPHLTTATEENLARLRDTEAGRALMAEAWAKCVDEARDLGWLHGLARDDVGGRNPYRESAP